MRLERAVDGEVMGWNVIAPNTITDCVRNRISDDISADELSGMGYTWMAWIMI